ncbi:Ribosome-recycling factor [Galdieria sulphuraria]|uniref:Ribosome recycling factor (Plastid) n=1 Tax=Galdieria sulphuraria TaxID=130081 RepID=M2VWP6_GALSU|nr:ribosome recycling factor [Galdieria sulphuraria]EME27671.1 ribosome recycling factor [Galdieria sulphuraria]GJD07439.1 Ribosome-recycling factor [Galdieria sulphuraria]|eukprot:XP_005704191.1 ribosome recycling factor [Galdieria sulphuraria]
MLLASSSSCCFIEIHRGYGCNRILFSRNCHACKVSKSSFSGFLLKKNASLSRRVLTQVCTAKVSSSEAQKEAEERMKKSLETVKNNLSTLRTGRANPALLDRLTVSYYGTETPLKSLASITASSATTLTIEPYDRSYVKDIEKAIAESDLALTPNNDGKSIRLELPPLTEERRKQLIKSVKQLTEEGRVAVRNIRRDIMDKLKKLEKDGELGKDEMKSIQDDIQKLTDKYIKLMEEKAKEKEKDLMSF